VVTLAKGLGGGLPIGATVAFGAAGDLLGPGSHGSTFGGNPISAAAALAVLDVIAEDNLLFHGRELGSWLAAELSGIPGVVGVRGLGLLLGVVLAEPRAKEVEGAARDRGLIINAAAPGVIRLAPPLLLGTSQARQVADTMADVISPIMADTVSPR
jgi:acetylornithine aminotransferase